MLQLLPSVHEILLPAISNRGFVVIDSDIADSFDNATVVLRAADLRMRIIRERGQIFADFGPPSEPATWFDSAVVLDYLGLPPAAPFTDLGTARALQAIGKLVNERWSELTSEFASAQLAVVKAKLEALRETRAARFFEPG